MSLLRNDLSLFFMEGKRYKNSRCFFWFTGLRRKGIVVRHPRGSTDRDGSGGIIVDQCYYVRFFSLACLTFASIQVIMHGKRVWSACVYMYNCSLLLRASCDCVPFLPSRFFLFFLFIFHICILFLLSFLALLVREGKKSCLFHSRSRLRQWLIAKRSRMLRRHGVAESKKETVVHE